MAARLAGRVGRTRGRVRAHTAMSEINVTPLVDVMLVLLVVFMVTAPLLTTGVSINLPKAKAHALSKQDNSPLEINLNERGEIYLGKTRVTLDRLSGLLVAMAQENPDRRVYIRGDHHLSYGQVMQVMTAVSMAGFTKVALVTDPTMRSKK